MIVFLIMPTVLYRQSIYPADILLKCIPFLAFVMKHSQYISPCMKSELPRELSCQFRYSFLVLIIGLNNPLTVLYILIEM